MRFYITILIVLFWCFIPKYVEAKPVPYENYARLPAIYDAAISPDGATLAAIVDNGGKYVLRMYDLSGKNKKPVAMGYDDGVKVRWIEWASNDRILVSTKQTEKRNGLIYNTGYLFAISSDLTEINMVLKPDLKNSKTGRRVATTTGFRQFNNHVIDFLPNDPEHIIMEFGKENQFNIGVYKVNITNPNKIRKLRRDSTLYQSWVTDANHEVRLGEGRKDRTGDYVMSIRDANSDNWQSVTHYPGLTAETSTFGFMENPNELIIGAYNDKDTLGLYVYDLLQKKRTRKLYHNDKYDVVSVIRNADRTRVIGVYYLADSGVKVFFDPVYKARAEKIQATLPGYLIRVYNQTLDGKKVIFKASSPSNSSVLYMYNATTGTSNALSYDYPEIGDTIQGDVTKVMYTARDGVKIPSYVTTPPKIAQGMPLNNLPFIIMPHGGPYARDTKNFDYLAQYMASRGYAVLQMNFRGSEGYGKDFENAGRENWVVMQEDVEDGARWLIKKGYADPKRVCIVGWSYGGYAALMGSITDPELYACSISIAGVTDLNDMVRDMKKYRFGKYNAKSFILGGFDGRKDLKVNSPVKRAAELTVPLLLVHGKKDVTVHYDQFTRMKNALKKSNSKVTTLVLDEGDHSLTNFADRKALFKAMDKFLVDNLGASAAAP